MPLRGKYPEHTDKRLKVLFYGKSGVGKTMTSIQFPTPYLIDTEGGAQNDQYINILQKNGGAVFGSTDFEEIKKELLVLLTEEHPYKTLIIDPLTTVYNSLLIEGEAKKGDDYGRHFGYANNKIKQLINILVRLDMNVIITSHAKNEYGDKLAVIGQTFDCYKKLDYLFDLVFEIRRQGKESIAFVEKSRIEAFPLDTTFKFTYDEIAKRYGKDILEKPVLPKILATPEEIEEAQRLINLLQLPSEISQKWLNKAKVSTFEELGQSDMRKILEYLNKKIKGEP